MDCRNVDCNQPEQAARFELALDQWIASLLESPRGQPVIARKINDTNQQPSEIVDELQVLRARLAKLEGEKEEARSINQTLRPTHRSSESTQMIRLALSKAG